MSHAFVEGRHSARSRPIDVPRTERLSDGLCDAIEYVSSPADDLTRRTQAGNDGGEH
jgi:hypothetical protein